MGEGILQIAIAVIIVVVLFKLAKNIAKKVFYLVITIAAIILLKGIVDWVMIETIGISLFVWIGVQMQSSFILLPVFYSIK